MAQNTQCGVGKLKNLQVQLHIDPNVKPVAQPRRRIPFYLQKNGRKGDPNPIGAQHNLISRRSNGMDFSYRHTDKG